MKIYKAVSIALILSLLFTQLQIGPLSAAETANASALRRWDVLRPQAVGDRSKTFLMLGMPENLVVEVFTGGQWRQAISLAGIVKCEIGQRDKLVLADLGTGPGEALDETRTLFTRSGYNEVDVFGVEEVGEIAGQDGLPAKRGIITARISGDLKDPRLLGYRGKVDVVTMHATVGAEYINFIRCAFELLGEEGILIIQPTIHESQRAGEFITMALKTINEETGFNVFYMQGGRCAGLFSGGTQKTGEVYIIKRDKAPLKTASFIDPSDFGELFPVAEREVLFPSLRQSIVARSKNVFPQGGRNTSRGVLRTRRSKQNLLARIQEAVDYLWQDENYGDLKRLIYKFRDVPGIGEVISQLSVRHTGNFYGAANELFVAERLVEMIPGAEVIGFRHRINRYEADILLKVYNSPHRRQRRKDLTFPLNNELYLVEAKYVSSLRDWEEALEAASEDRVSGAISMARWFLGRDISVGGVIIALGGLGIEESYDEKLEKEPGIRFDFRKRRFECNLYSLTLRHDIKASGLSNQTPPQKPDLEQILKWSQPVPVTSLALEKLIKRPTVNRRLAYENI